MVTDEFERRKVQLAESGRVIVPLRAGQRGQRLRNQRQWPPGGQGQHLQLGGFFQVIQFVQRLRHRGADHDDAMVAHEEHAFALPHQSGHALTLGSVQRHARVVAVVGNAAMKAAGVLVQRHPFKVLQAAQRGGVLHVGVQDAAGLRYAPVQFGVQVPGGRVGGHVALQGASVAAIEQ